MAAVRLKSAIELEQVRGAAIDPKRTKQITDSRGLPETCTEMGFLRLPATRFPVLRAASLSWGMVSGRRIRN